MELELALVQGLAFLTVFLLVVGIKAALAGPVAEDELAARKPGLFRLFVNEATSLGKWAGPAVNPAMAAQTKQLEIDLVVASLPLEVNEVRGMQVLLASAFGLAAGLGTFIVSLNGRYAIIGLFCFALLGWIYPVVFVTGAARRRKEAMSRSLPFAIDLLTVAMQAGQDFGAAVRHLVNEGLRGPLAQEFGIMLKQTELGKSRVEALKAMAERIQVEEFKSLVTAVAQSSEMGASISQTLKMQAEDLRRARFHTAERKAARAPSLMLIPMALFILPAVFIIIFTPVVIRVMDSGMSGYFGH
ncbi:MAG: type II secretion system F family protein [Lentisphaeria bacterium]